MWFDCIPQADCEELSFQMGEVLGSALVNRKDLKSNILQARTKIKDFVRKLFKGGGKKKALSRLNDSDTVKPGTESNLDPTDVGSGGGSQYQRMRTSAKFLNENKYFDGTNWKPLTKSQRRDIFSGIDFSKPVNVRTLDKGTALVQDVRVGGAPGPWFRSPGTSASEIGLWTGGRQSVNFRTTLPTQVLETRARPIFDNWSEPGVSVPTQGGGIQFYTFQGYKIWPQ